MRYPHFILVLLLTLGAIHTAISADNVSFNDVLAVDFAAPDAQLVYGAENVDLQYGLLWLPPGLRSAPAAGRSIAPVPLVIFIHGGCWMNAFDVTHTFALSSALAQAGYAVWSLEYRRTGDEGGGWPGTFEDVLAGVQWRHNLQDYPIDSEDFVIMGHSAGGHLALLAGSQVESARAVIGLAPISDIVAYARGSNSCQSATTSFMGTDPDTSPQLFAAANPVQQALHNNTYLLEGAADEIVPLSTTLIPGTRSLIVQSAGHFDWVHPDTRAYHELLQLLHGLFER